MSNNCNPSCSPVVWCSPPNFATLYPDLVGPTGPTVFIGPFEDNGVAVENIAALKAIPTVDLTNATPVFVEGYYAPNDGGGGGYVYNSTSVLVDNGGTIIAPNSGVGRWLLVNIGGFINVVQFGAKGDGATDDTARITLAILAAPTNGTVFFPSGRTFLTVSQITVPADGVTLSGYGATITSTLETQFQKFLFSGVVRGGVFGLRFNCIQTVAIGVVNDGVIEIANSADITIRDCEFNDVMTDGVYVHSKSERCRIENNRFSRNFCAILSDDDTVHQPTELHITGNSIIAGLGSVTTAFSGGIKCSGIGGANAYAGHVISGNTLDLPGQMGIEIQNSVNETSITNNTVIGAGFGVSISQVYNCTVAANTFKKCNYCGVEVALSFFCTVTGNAAEGLDATGVVVTSRGIVVDQSNDTTVTGNIIHRCDLYLFVAKTTMLLGNSVYGGAIYLKASSHTTVVGNIITAIPGGGLTLPTVGIVMDVDGIAVTIYGTTISNNIFKGTFSYSLIGFSATAGSAVVNGVVITGNDCSEALVGLEGVTYSLGGVATITNYRSFGNIANSADFNHSSIDLAGSCTVHRTSDQSIANTSEVTMTWEAAYFNDASSPFSPRWIWNGATPTVLILPPYAKRVRVSANIRWEGNASGGSRRVKIKSNNAAGVYPLNAVWACVTATPGTLSTAASDMSLTTPVIDVQNIDSFIVTVEHDSGAALKVLGSGNFVPGTNFCLEILP